jgi:hypothetical protein
MKASDLQLGTKVKKESWVKSHTAFPDDFTWIYGIVIANTCLNGPEFIVVEWDEGFSNNLDIVNVNDIELAEQGE